MVDHYQQDSKPGPKEVGLGSLASSRPIYPLGFEDFIEVVGPSKQDHKQRMSTEIVECENSLEKENEINQNFRESHDPFPSSGEKIPQTSLLDSNSNRMSVVMEGMVCEEDLVEVRISLDIGKTLRLKASN